MKTNPLLVAVVLATVPFATGVVAQTPAAPPPPAPSESPASVPTTDVAASPQPNQLVYAPRLPTAQELTNVAAARGVTIERIEQTSSQVTVIYKLPDGQTNVVGYVLLPAANAPTSATMVTTPAPNVIYRAAPRAVYYYPGYYDSGYYDPWYAYSPVAISLGFGFGHYYGGNGHFRGGHQGRR